MALKQTYSGTTTTHINNKPPTKPKQTSNTGKKLAAGRYA